MIALAPVVETARADVRIKDIASFEGVRENQLVGYGLVVGLNGTGDTLRNSPFTEKSIEGMLERLGVGNLSEDNMRTQNTAAVMVTAMLPPFARRGSTIDVVVSSLGDASSLRGGTLIVTPLSGADGEVYAVAQGPIAVAGYAAQGVNASIVEGVPTVARIENGATVENEIDFTLASLRSFRIALRSPDMTTAHRVAEKINMALGPGTAQVLDPSTIEVMGNDKGDTPEMMAAVENLMVQPDSVAKVVIDARSGTIVIGSNVRVDKVAVSQGGLTVVVREDIEVSQPEPISIGGTTVVVPQTEVEVQEAEVNFTILEGDVSLQRLVDGLNAIGVTASQTISILQAIKAAGALHADLEII
ncbi:MAG: flagellar basal body P-ring protein FlgI [Pseudomonadota bacterium]|jgi:flagellar P-ring protein precursor FlgI|uniref:Flagellar P-ring protein n=3 Tax=Pseudooceanicola nitratireducens TaxID=517719 RepID=A0A1I1PXY5_9RHOB|nr:flagellar basal body P-ring protein FlgI [Pseudooceanicola nitratireducens]MEC7297803.1 flagellar basal body P-ring protein FlgI [Pseudomonadota bacterium]MEC7793527.1 flagellar basal body P-ring protein FlgI [Pseudomonadota bacterium]MEC8668958.1 flagellar basal body P-ring protein FlgI [Pseudomonadota bacterium]SEJ70579.1 flagellar P-ring protein precursor FlgI [Pseudooceanicola nitratireducens]SFD14625.1 flagellar P-ring protein precursor FlgI [Pseudooceanicola nitratireducens]